MDRILERIDGNPEDPPAVILSSLERALRRQREIRWKREDSGNLLASGTRS
jgi:hypothetical protein